MRKSWRHSSHEGMQSSAIRRQLKISRFSGTYLPPAVTGLVHRAHGSQDVWSTGSGVLLSWASPRGLFLFRLRPTPPTPTIKDRLELPMG